MTEPLIKGGQGRSGEDLLGNATVIVWAVLIAAVLLLVFA